MSGKPFFDSTGIAAWNKGTVGVMKSWNKGLRGHLPQETRNKLSEAARNRFQQPSQHPRWRGGIRTHGGYRMCFKPDHPFASANRCVPEHRLIMEGHLGRYLDPDEVVHHINQDKTDNRLSNLMLFATHQAHMAFHATQIGIKGRPKKKRE